VQLFVQGRLAGAGLDVFAREPVVPQQLCEMANVVVLPHVGSAKYGHAQRWPSWCCTIWTST